MGKIILVDWCYLMFRAIFSWEKTRAVPPTYTAVAMIISNLKKVGLDKEDKVILAIDSPTNWRKELDPNYKSNRKEKREKHDIDWKKVFSSFSDLVEKLELYTPFHTIKVDKMEADDIIAYSCKKFPDKECVIISSDSDYEQLCALKNVRLFSPLSKKYKLVENPYKIIAKKIRKETADNLVSPILTKEDYDLRNKLVNLLNLPKEVEEAIDEHLNCLPDKEWDIDKLPFNGLHNRFKTVYDKDKVVSIHKKIRKKRKLGKQKEIS